MEYKIVNIKGFPGYMVDTNGDVWSFRQSGRFGNRDAAAKKVKIFFCGLRRYGRVCLSKNKKLYSPLIHRIIATAFIPNPQKYPCVCHIDANPRNNAISNLKWGTYKQNSQDMVLAGNSTKGERHGQHKLTSEQVKEIKARLQTTPRIITDIAREYGVTPATVYYIKIGATWKHITV